MLRRVCGTSVVTLKQLQCQSQVRLFNASAMALKDMNMDQTKQTNIPNPPKGSSGSSGSSGAGGSNMTMPIMVVGGAAAAGAAYYFMKGSKPVENAKDSVAGHLITHKANKEFENAKEVVLKVAKEVGGQELADKVAKLIDEAKDTVMKMAKDMNLPQNAGKVYRQGKEMYDNVSESGIGDYVKQFDNVKDSLLKEAEKMGGKDLVKKATKTFDEAKDKISKLSMGKGGISEYVKEYENVKDFVLKEIKKNGGEDFAKKATQTFEEAKNQMGSIASNIAKNGLGDKEFEQIKQFVVKEAERIGGRDLAKKAAKMMDEAKETIQKIANEIGKVDLAGKAMEHVKDTVQKKIQ